MSEWRETLRWLFAKPTPPVQSSPEELRAEQEQREARLDAIEAETGYRPLGNNLALFKAKGCGICGAWIWDASKHTAWHDGLGEDWVGEP